MGEKVKKVTGKVKEASGKISKKIKILIVIVLVLAVAVIVGLNIYNNSRPYSVLFTGLNDRDMSSVLNYLNEHGVSDYIIEKNDTILVRESQEVSLKAAILQEGYPTSGYSYGTYLDNIGMLSSESDRKQLSTYDLQEQLKAVIRSFEGVRDASVNIATTNSSRYILSDSVQNATAAVKVEMQSGKEMTEKLAAAIRNYVTHSVQGLSFSDVEIVDSAGNRFSGTGETDNLKDSADLKMSLQDSINKQTREAVMRVLSPYFGAQNLSVSVHSEVDTSRTYSEVVNYLEPEWSREAANGRGIIGRWVWDSGIVRGENANAGGVVGTSTNADLNEYVINEGDVTGNEQEIGTAGEIDYNVGSERTQKESAGGLLTDLMVAVAINRTAVENDITPADWVPLVARAAGIGTALQDEKIAIQVYPFYVAPEQEPEPTPEPEPTLMERLNLPWWAMYAAIGGGALFLIALVVFFIIRAKIRKKKKAKEAALQAAQQPQYAYAPAPEDGSVPPSADDGADIMGMNTERSMELRKEVRQFAEENPSIAAQMIKNWLHGSDQQ